MTKMCLESVCSTNSVALSQSMSWNVTIPEVDCSGFYEVLQNNDKPTKPEKLNKHHPCNLLASFEFDQKDCLNYKKVFGFERCNSDKKCMEKNCKMLHKKGNGTFSSLDLD